MIKHFHTHVSICPSFKYVYMPYQPEKKIFITEVRFLLLVLVYVCVCVRTFVHTFQFIGITRRIQRFTGRKLVLRCTCIDVEVLYYYFLLRVKQWNRKEELKYTCISVCMCVCGEGQNQRNVVCWKTQFLYSTSLSPFTRGAFHTQYIAHLWAYVIRCSFDCCLFISHLFLLEWPNRSLTNNQMILA